ncbi:DNA-processing protein DprA [Cyanobacterium aponinum]|uniref:DNA-processing protein DprA n=1 Tax=Cyanobacterium aponinum 0216 TaxID=2676140 RepID=A0A844GNV2_9CHRO|nr:DNA-processing protein DprA [Cyanobacterium aponinum]MTF37500.1 DNA-processing protein DprA [Cyanobacterium aponinum 0216]
MNRTESQDYWLNETVALLTLSQIKGVGYWTMRNLADQKLSFKQVLKAETSEKFIQYLKLAKARNINQILEIWQSSIIDLWENAVNLYRDLKNQQIQVLHSGQQEFPQRLKEIDDSPKWLFIQGNMSILNQNAISIVGTRNPSEDGKFLVKYIGSCLTYWKEIVTVSGLAYGIDQNIHEESIRFNIPTIAFLGTGILLNYPANSENLRQRILEKGGAIVSEYLPTDSYSSENFVRRNRLQAGLANTVIAVEWKSKSGTAHTIRYAHQAKRQIICLKLPDWLDLQHPELLMAQEMGAKIFTIPGQECELIKTIQRSINSTKPESSSIFANSSKINNYKQLQLNLLD